MFIMIVATIIVTLAAKACVRAAFHAFVGR